MCFGLPCQVIETDGLSARVAGAGREETVSLALTGPVPAGAHVLVYLGSAVRELSAEEAAQISGAIEAVQAAARGAPYAHHLQDLIDREPELPAHLQGAAKAASRTRREDDPHAPDLELAERA